ncbi:terpene synthase family protein [Streptomyces sp. QH1-20]|uniref:terpene synthase family protein n=1 Tax=Streptomyces sp. QH1-20 TaxID=3240934 RepID=UPI003519B87C
MPQDIDFGLPFPLRLSPDLDLCTDVMAFFFVIDDQLDGPLGAAPERVARVCQGLIDIVHGTPPAPGADPCSVAFADLGRRSTDEAPARVGGAGLP